MDDLVMKHDNERWQNARLMKEMLVVKA